MAKQGKRIFAALLLILLVFTLCGCKSQAVKDMEKAIDEVGELSVEKGALIYRLKDEFDALSDSDQKKVSNRDKLTELIDGYSELCSKTVDEAKKAIKSNDSKTALSLLEPILEYSEEARDYYDELNEYLFEGTYVLKPTYFIPELREDKIVDNNTEIIHNFVFTDIDDMSLKIVRYWSYLKTILVETEKMDFNNGLGYKYSDTDGNKYLYSNFFYIDYTYYLSVVFFV